MKLLGGWYIWSGIEDRVEYKDHSSGRCQLPRYLTDSAPLSIVDIHATTSMHYTDIFDLSYPLVAVVVMGALFEDTITTPYWRPYHVSWNVEDGPKILLLMWRLILRRALIFASCRLHHSIQYQILDDKCCRFAIMSFIGVIDMCL